MMKFTTLLIWHLLALTHAETKPLWGDTIEFVVKRPMTIFYNQVKKQEGMRSLYFQNGDTHTADMPLKWKLAWCGLQVGLKMDENIDLAVGTIFTPGSYQVDSNQKDIQVHTWSFVATRPGFKERHYPKFSPFVFQCSLQNGLPMNQAVLETIVGKFLSTQSLPQPELVAPKK